MWDSLPDKDFFQKYHSEGASGNGSIVSFLGYKWNGDYGSAIAFSYAYKRPLYIRIVNGEWIEGITL